MGKQAARAVLNPAFQPERGAGAGGLRVQGAETKKAVQGKIAYMAGIIATGAMAKKNYRRLHIALPLIVIVNFIIVAVIRPPAVIFGQYGNRGSEALASCLRLLLFRQKTPPGGIGKMSASGLCLLLLAACAPVDNYMPRLREVHLQNGLRFSLPENWASRSGEGYVDFYAEAFLYDQEARHDRAVLRMAVIRAPRSPWAHGAEESAAGQYLRVIEQKLRLTLPATEWNESVRQPVNNLTLLRFSYRGGEVGALRDHFILYTYGREYIISLDFCPDPFIRRQVDMFINSLYFTENGNDL
jgi:hypothetical protein